MRSSTRLEHERRILEAVWFLTEHLDECLDLREIADHVCLSRFHFHRMFQTLLGETVGDMTRRLRLERAADALRTSSLSVTEIAFEAGYGSLESFIRAFRGAYGYSPSTFRRDLTYRGHLPTVNGWHFNSPQDKPIRFLAAPGATTMNVEVREIGPRRAVVMPHSGPYYMIGRTFEQFGQWAGEAGLPGEHGIAIYYDDPENTPADQLRSDAGQLVPLDYTTTDERVKIIDLPAGKYVVGLHVGPYESVGATWAELCGQWLPQSGHSFGTGNPYELYLNECTNVPPEELKTELWVSVQ